MRAFASILLTAAQCAQLKDEFVPNPKYHVFEYPGVHGHIHQDSYEGVRKSVQQGSIQGENFDYYPVPHGIDYDDFYQGFNQYNPNDEKHYYNDISHSDYYVDSAASDDYTSSDYHDSYSGDAGYLHSHGLSHDSSRNDCGSSRCDSTTHDEQSHLDSIQDSEYREYIEYNHGWGYVASSLASSDDPDGDLTSDLDGGDSSYGSSGVFAVNPFSVTFDSSDIDSDGYLTTHSSSYSNRSSFGYGTQSDHTSRPGASDFDFFEHDGFGGYNGGVSPFIDYYGRHK